MKACFFWSNGQTSWESLATVETLGCAREAIATSKEVVYYSNKREPGAKPQAFSLLVIASSYNAVYFSTVAELLKNNSAVQGVHIVFENKHDVNACGVDNAPLWIR